MRTTAAGLVAALAACGPSEADVTLARTRMFSVSVSESLVSATEQVCIQRGGGESACRDHWKARSELETKKSELDAFCTSHFDACQRAKQLDEIRPR